ncbi:M20 family metallo-hydrolase [Mesorhizobium sp. 1M-11]|uniref:M20 family metallo-hydrolase n=1 Tax=Mesorhizobium sp. 1M-11 TaxID=1529006 RepID=UPI0006C75EE3|nr:M20 family metallo-hydrolase [Mesorhizobium sp. 1M-11]
MPVNANSNSLDTLAGHVDQYRLWQRHLDMARIGATPLGGVHRLPFSKEDIQSRRLFLSWADARGFASMMDDFGNLFVRREGSESGLAPVVSGSHSDTQPNGGRFDGIYGVLAAFEALEAIDDAGIVTRRPIEVVIWTAEEADAQFGVGCLGSQAHADPDKLPQLMAIRNNQDISVGTSLAEFLDDHPRVSHRQFRSPIAYYVEAHIEQGPELEAQGKTIGIVTAIQGHRSFKVQIVGEASHAGATPERLRKDALVAAMEIFSELRKVFHDPQDIVRFTVGEMDVAPGAMAVVPGSVTFTIDFRHPDPDILRTLGDQIAVVAREKAGRCEASVSELRHSSPVQFTGPVPDAILKAVESLNYSRMFLPSGAGHDARYIAELAPAGMIFIPCWRGISHNEAESAELRDMVAGVNVLANTLVQLANL